MAKKEISNPDVNPLYNRELETPYMEALEQSCSDKIGAYEGPKPIAKMYHIFHCIEKASMFTEKERQPRKYVGYVLAKDMQEAYTFSQNDDPNWSLYQERSTSIGDIIQDDYGFYMVLGIGFTLLCTIEEDGHE